MADSRDHLAAVEDAKAEEETAPSRRMEIVEGLRKLADVIDTTDLPLPLEPYGIEPMINVEVLIPHDADVDERGIMETAARALPGRKTKSTTESFFKLRHEFAPGVEYSIWAPRESVCKPVVKGEKTVTRNRIIRDAEYEKVEETVPEIEWDCGPVLRAAVGEE